MTKNVNVVDDLGNRYVPTYAKRAKGLVKNGRARWVDENTICLACPPDDMNLEDTEMENKINPINDVEVQAECNEKEILKRIDRIIAQADGLSAIIEQIRDLPMNESPMGGKDGAARAEAIGNIYAERERTNQKMLGILERMYADAHPNAVEILSSLKAMDLIAMDTELAMRILDLIGK